MPLLQQSPNPNPHPSILASLSIHHAMYDRSPTSSSSGSPLPLWHSVKRWPAKAPAPTRPLLGLLSSLSWPDSTAPPASTSLLHPALTLTLPVAILGDKIASGHLWAGGFIPGLPLNFSESCMRGWDCGAPRWLCWGKQRVWVLCHKPGL